MAIDEKKDGLFYTISEDLIVLHRIDGAYQVVEEISVPNYITRIEFLNGFLVVSSLDTSLRFYRGSDYELEKVITAGFARIDGFSETDDQSLLTIGGQDGYVRIFSFDGASYTQIQQIYAGFFV